MMEYEKTRCPFCGNRAKLPGPHAFENFKYLIPHKKKCFLRLSYGEEITTIWKKTGPAWRHTAEELQKAWERMA